MVQLRSLMAVLAALMVFSILFSGCTGQKGESQPPARTITIATTMPATPVPETSVPVQPGTTPSPPTPVVTPPWMPGTVAQSGTAVLITGDIVGLKSARGPFIDAIQFTVVKAPRVDPVTFDIPNTQIIFTKSGKQFGSNYQILSGDENGDHILDEGESFVVLVHILPPYEIYAGQNFIMAIQTPPTQVIVTAEAPPVLTDQPMVLATAPT